VAGDNDNMTGERSPDAAPESEPDYRFTLANERRDITPQVPNMVIVAEGLHRHDRGMYDTGHPRAACGAGFQLQSRDAARKRRFTRPSCRGAAWAQRSRRSPAARRLR
jgi:hypothetical protein